MLNWEDPDSILITDLVEVMRWKGELDIESKEFAKQAGLAFYHRFGQWILMRAEILCAKHGRQVSDGMIITEKAIRNFIHKGDFSFEKSIIKDPTSAVKSYLNKIIYHELVNLQRKELSTSSLNFTGEEGLLYEIEEWDIFKGDIESNKDLLAVMYLTDEVLKDVNPVHKMIFLTLLNAGVIDGIRPPKHLKKLLMDTTDLTWVSIKGIKNEIFKRIKPRWDVYSKKK